MGKLWLWGNVLALSAGTVRTMRCGPHSAVWLVHHTTVRVVLKPISEPLLHCIPMVTIIKSSKKSISFDRVLTTYCIDNQRGSDSLL